MQRRLHPCSTTWSCWFLYLIIYPSPYVSSFLLLSHSPLDSSPGITPIDKSVHRSQRPVYVHARAESETDWISVFGIMAENDKTGSGPSSPRVATSPMGKKGPGPSSPTGLSPGPSAVAEILPAQHWVETAEVGRPVDNQLLHDEPAMPILRAEIKLTECLHRRRGLIRTIPARSQRLSPRRQRPLLQVFSTIASPRQNISQRHRERRLLVKLIAIDHVILFPRPSFLIPHRGANDSKQNESMDIK